MVSKRRAEGMKCIKILILVLFTISLFPKGILAQEARKIAYINAAAVFDNYYKTKDADAKLEKKGEKKNKEREGLIKDINKLKDETELLSMIAREKKEAELNEKMRKLQDFDRETKTNLQRERNDLVKDIFKEIDDAIQEYGKKNGYDIIFDSRVLLYASDGLDITEDVTNKLNSKR